MNCINKMYCPFGWLRSIAHVCVYDPQNIDECDDTEICPGNSDAWCVKMIERALVCQEDVEG